MERINCENRIPSKLSFIESLIRVLSTWIMDHGPYESTKKKKKKIFVNRHSMDFNLIRLYGFLFSFHLLYTIIFFYIVNIKHTDGIFCASIVGDLKWEMFVFPLCLSFSSREHIYSENGSYGSWALGLYQSCQCMCIWYNDKLKATKNI